MNYTKFYIVRHGESLGNAVRKFLGHTDLDLSEVGYEQARVTAEQLRGVNFDKIYSSDLIRAYNTVLCLAQLRDMEIYKSRELRELMIGEWENMLLDDIISAYNNEYVNGWLADFYNFVCPGGESVAGAGDRFFNCLYSIAKENPGKTILIGAHAAVIRSFWIKINKMNKSLVDGSINFPTNASYSTVLFDGEKFVPEDYSCDAHLFRFKK